MFTTETAGLLDVLLPSVTRLHHGDHLYLGIGAVRMGPADATLRMLAYNGSIPGPTLHVDQGCEVTVHVTNHGDVETTVHWHGLRLENRYDGVPHDTQEPIAIGGSFSDTLQFPDAGFYWYQTHLPEDFAQDMGLDGPIIVEPTDPSYQAPVDRHLTVTLDDLLVEDISEQRGAGDDVFGRSGEHDQGEDEAPRVPVAFWASGGHGGLAPGVQW